MERPKNCPIVPISFIVFSRLTDKFQAEIFPQIPLVFHDHEGNGESVAVVAFFYCYNEVETADCPLVLMW